MLETSAIVSLVFDSISLVITAIILADLIKHLKSSFI